MAAFSCRARDGVHVYALEQSEDVLDLTARPTASAKLVRYSNDGILLGWSTETSLVIVNATSGEVVSELKRVNVIDFRLSPLNTFVATWQRPASSVNGEQPADNIAVTKIGTGEVVMSAFNRSMVHWEPQWTRDEVLLTRVINKSEILVYNGRTIADGIKSRIKVDGVTHAELAPGPAPYKIAAFTPVKTNMPASVKMFACEAAGAPLALKSFFKADKVDILWNENGTKALVLTQTEVDMSGKSYFGETNLYYMDSNGKFDQHVTLDKEGPIHEVAWSPNGREFVVVYGSKLFDSKCTAIFDFGAASRNMVQYNPQGTLICLAGFGNLAGEMEFWSRETLKRVNVVQARDTTYFEWCPDGRHVMSAILSPRLRVDNGFRIFHYNGHIVSQGSFKELYQVTWRPGRYPTRPISPAPGSRPQPVVVNTGAENMTVSSTSSPASASSSSPSVNSPSAAAPAPAKKGVYVPPHMRNQVAAGSNAAAGPRKLYELMGEQVDSSAKAAKEEEDDEQSKASALRKKKRENKRAANEAGQPLSSAAAAPVSVPAAASAPNEESELDKKIRNLAKKLKAIDLLKEEQAKGKKLEANQLDKLKTHGALLEEMEALKALK